MRQSLHILFISALILLVSSCNKKEAETPIDPATGCTNCTPSSATSFIGFLKAGTYTTTAALSSSTIISRVSAFFSGTATNMPSTVNSVSVNAVFFNNDTLKYIGAPYYYCNYLPVNLSSETWSVTGSGTIPSFTFKNLKEKPSFAGIGALPDTVKKNIGFAFVINDLKNITAASVFISDGLSTPSVFSKLLVLGSDTLTFSAENLSALNTSTNAIITIFMENSFGITVEGKDMKMSNEASYSKRVVIKN